MLSIIIILIMALTLNQTSRDDNLAIWLVKIWATGRSIVEDGTFDTACGAGNWACSGDWSIGSGVATYTYSANASGDLDQELAAATAEPYILEYEVTALSGTGYTIHLRGGASGTLFNATQIELPITLGKHRIMFYGDSGGGTRLRFGAGGFGASDSITIDNIKVKKAEDPIYVSTKDITISGQDWDGNSLHIESDISDVMWQSNAETGGGLGGVSGYMLSVKRYSENELLDGWQDEFAPAFTGADLSAAIVDIGIVWDVGTPTNSHITWLMRGRVLDYDFEQRRLNLYIQQESTVTSKEIPYYSIQNDFDNDVSYFDNAPEDNYGLSMPIVYGGMNLGNLEESGFNSVPCYLVNQEKSMFVISSHEVNSSGVGATTDELMKYISSLDIYELVSHTSGDAFENSVIRHTFSMNDSPGTAKVAGQAYIPLKVLSSHSDVSSIQNCVDNSFADEYIEVDGGETLVLKVRGIATTADIGWLSGLAVNHIRIAFYTKSPTGTRSVDIGYHNDNISSPGTFPNGTNTTSSVTTTSQYRGHSFGTHVTSKKDSSLPWTVEEITGLDFYLTNNEAPGNVVRVYFGTVQLFHITLVGLVGQFKGIVGRTILSPFESTQTGVKSLFDFQRGATSIFDLFKRRTEKVKAELTDMFAVVEGREFGRWTDNVRGGARSNGYNEGDLIECPPYIIESLLRDEHFTERDLILDQQSTTTFKCRQAQVLSDDYYNYSEFFNATTVTKKYISDFVGSTNLFTISSADGSMADDDNFFLTNIRGDYKIDETTFDALGHSLSGTRKDWVFGRCVNTKTPIDVTLEELLDESHSILFESINETSAENKLKIVALDEASSGDTWTSPIIQDGKVMAKTSYTSLSNIATSFKLFYYYDYGKGDYLKSILVDKQGYSNPSGGTTLTDEHQNLCHWAEKTYKIVNPFSYSSNWIYEDATAEYYLDKKIRWFTKQRLKVTWMSPLADASFDYIANELGDQVKLNNTDVIPTGLNNSSYFMIVGKKIVAKKGDPYIIWNLLEMS